MLRLCSDSSRSYPGRPVSRAIVLDGAAAGNSCRDGAGVSRSHSRRRKPSQSDWTVGNKPGIESREALPRRRAKHRTGKEPQ